MNSNGQQLSKFNEDYKLTDPRGTRNVKKVTPRHIILKLLKISGKEKILKGVMYRGAKLRMTSDFDPKQMKRQGSSIFKTLKEKLPI